MDGCECALTICAGVLGYYLFYSTHNYDTLGYDVKYAVSKKLNTSFKKVGSFLSR